MVKLLASCIIFGRFCVQILAQRPVILSEGFRGFLQFLFRIENAYTLHSTCWHAPSPQTCSKCFYLRHLLSLQMDVTPDTRIRVNPDVGNCEWSGFLSSSEEKTVSCMCDEIVVNTSIRKHLRGEVVPSFTDFTLQTQCFTQSWRHFYIFSPRQLLCQNNKSLVEQSSFIVDTIMDA
jgi:hypothetical protein